MSSSSSEGNVFLDNLPLLRSHSLDPGLVEEYFNKAAWINPKEADLDATDSSSSSSGPGEGFSIVIDLVKGARDPLYREASFPQDIQFHVHDETLNGSDIGGSISATRIPGSNRVLVQMAGHEPNGSDEFSFVLNAEHPSISTSRTRFTFRSNRAYQHELRLAGAVPNRPGRIDGPYKAYLLDWIGRFWDAYDSDDVSLVPAFVRPEGNRNTEFDPFAHAKWRVLKDLPGGPALSALDLKKTNFKMVEGWNFLGVSQDIWDCIGAAQLYQDYPRDLSFLEWLTNNSMTPDRNFDCRSFSVASANFLRDQLKGVCDNPRISYFSTYRHSMLYVELGGSPSPCCEGSFLYDGINGTTTTVREYCDENPEECKEGAYLGFPRFDYPYPTPYLNRFGYPNWDAHPEEVQRIKDVVCGCLPDDYLPNTAEHLLKQKCDAGTFGEWFRKSFRFREGYGTEVPPEVSQLPRILSCEKSLCLSSPGQDGSPCLVDPQGAYEPYVCGYSCMGRWSCDGQGSCFEVFSFGGTLGDYGTELECKSDCDLGAWCLLDPVTYEKNGQCREGSKKTYWDSSLTGLFREGKTCQEIESACTGCEQGYLSVPRGGGSWGTPAVAPDDAPYQCVPDCNSPYHPCDPGSCCRNNIIAGGNFCEPCPTGMCCRGDPLYGSVCDLCEDKTSVLRFYD